MNPRRVLFVCEANRLRSPTAEAVFREMAGLEVRSAGLSSAAVTRVTEEMVAWADIVFVMDRPQRNKLRKLFRGVCEGTRIVNLDIPDEYEYMEPALVVLLKHKVGSVLEVSF